MGVLCLHGMCHVYWVVRAMYLAVPLEFVSVCSLHIAAGITYAHRTEVEHRLSKLTDNCLWQQCHHLQHPLDRTKIFSLTTAQM